MPKLSINEGPYRFFFYSDEGNEPPHVHVRRDKNVAKFWLDPVQLEKSGGFPNHEINSIRKIVEEHETLFLEEWHEFFNV